ncbi:hypothetical protein L208DRAFT_354752 [Tricholoma matsutake]|nr:hypothetical protein L208DRAFT_354752 [Tricholoma matsutake 945]
MLACGGLCRTTPTPGGRHREGNTNEMVWRWRGIFFWFDGNGSDGVQELHGRSAVCRRIYCHLEQCKLRMMWKNKATPRVLSVLNSS